MSGESIKSNLLARIAGLSFPTVGAVCVHAEKGGWSSDLDSPQLSARLLPSSGHVASYPSNSVMVRIGTVPMITIGCA